MTSPDEASALLARHLRVLASAAGVTDWPAYIRSVADHHDAGTAWLDEDMLDGVTLCGSPAADVPMLATYHPQCHTWVPCMLPAGHDPRAGHWSTSGSAGGQVRWTDGTDPMVLPC
jgi:hypothetical protein